MVRLTTAGRQPKRGWRGWKPALPFLNIPLKILAVGTCPARRIPRDYLVESLFDVQINFPLIRSKVISLLAQKRAGCRSLTCAVRRPRYSTLPLSKHDPANSWHSQKDTDPAVEVQGRLY